MATSDRRKSSNLSEDALRYLMEIPVGGWGAPDLLVAREVLDLTQAELAAAIGYDRSAIAKIEGGDVPPRLVVELAVRYLIDRRPQGNKFKPKEPPNISRFRPEGTAIGIRRDDVEVHLAEGPPIWVRLMPEFDSGRRFSLLELRNAATQGGIPLVQLIDGYSSLGFLWGVDGFGVYPTIGDRLTPAVSFAFETGEIWSVDTYIITAVTQHAPVDGRRGMPYLEDRFKYAAHMFRIMLSRLGVSPPLRWIVGIEGIKNVGLYYPPPTGQYFLSTAPHGKSLVDIVWETGIMEESDTPADALRPFFVKMFNTFAVERPGYLDDLSNPR